MRLAIRTGAIATLSIAAMGLGTPLAFAHGDEGGSAGGGGGYGASDDRSDGRGDVRAASYINPDTGAATENPDVKRNSSCADPDQRDKQRLSDAGTVNRNVHNDACFLDDEGKKVNGPASFQSSGVGSISACPDPDGAGPEYARLSDTDRDGRNDLCFQSSYQTTGAAGDFEFHARLNNTATPGTQYVVWCADADADGCRDERVKDDITITWTDDPGDSMRGNSHAR
ncbi:hypothetical protein SAMN05660350_02622 [Geodermatophilus obscurus]|uniref:Uncharacterized protein n=1 Tax=Geodermatophilus obscurus TaxID=1861 RepID=A0A1M7U5T3_9ACTN|nr:hypothetical protein [Geodermatophilus obscurus]SHN78482.1 hypothetical protein SAMN05660350_02622 [Geodermatophilus obscurus]